MSSVVGACFLMYMYMYVIVTCIHVCYSMLGVIIIVYFYALVYLIVS